MMNAEILKAEIFRRLVVKGFKFPPPTTGYPTLKDITDTIAEEVIKHIQIYATVSGMNAGVVGPYVVGPPLAPPAVAFPVAIIKETTKVL